MTKMYKKILIITIVGILLLILTGCNYQLVDLDYQYDTIICNYDGNQFELEIDKWTDYEGEQLQIKSGGKTYLFSANKCYMVGD